MSVVASDKRGTLFSSMLIKWRKLRKYSQLELALDANVSQRHLSFLESGRAKPSREMVLNLSQALELPLRERNLLLNAAGFSAQFRERNLDNEEMKVVQQALKMSLAHHEPFPAIVADRNWNLVMSNDAAIRLVGLLGEPESIWRKVDPQGNKNVYRMTFHPEGMRSYISNWDELAKTLLTRLQREVNADPDNEYLNTLLQDMLESSNVDLTGGLTGMIQPLAPVLPMEMSYGGVTLKMFSMISSFGTALDITAEELKIETFFPADEFTSNFFKQLAKNT